MITTLPPITIAGAPVGVQLPIVPGTAWRWALIANESTYALQVQVGGDTTWLGPATVNLYRLVGNQTQIVLNPTLQAGPTPTGTVLVTLGEQGDDPPVSTWPTSLPDVQLLAGAGQQLPGSPFFVGANAVVTQAIALPPALTTIAVVLQTPSNVDTLTVVGATTNKVYLATNPRQDGQNGIYPAVRVWPTLDPVVNVTVGTQVSKLAAGDCYVTTGSAGTWSPGVGRPTTGAVWHDFIPTAAPGTGNLIPPTTGTNQIVWLHVFSLTMDSSQLGTYTIYLTETSGTTRIATVRASNTGFVRDFRGRPLPPGAGLDVWNDSGATKFADITIDYALY